MLVCRNGLKDYYVNLQCSYSTLRKINYAEKLSTLVNYNQGIDDVNNFLLSSLENNNLFHQVISYSLSDQIISTLLGLGLGLGFRVRVS